MHRPESVDNTEDANALKAELERASRNASEREKELEKTKRAYRDEQRQRHSAEAELSAAR
jgi:hypothetical protein